MIGLMVLDYVDGGTKKNTMYNVIKKIFSKSVVQIENPKLSPIDYYNMGNILRKVLYNYLNTKIKEWLSNVEIPLSVGDIVVLDKYNMNNSFNNWDGGPNLIINKKHKPFKLEIVEVSCTQSLATERIDKYLNNIDYNKFFNDDGSIITKSLEYNFEIYCTRNSVPYMKTDNHYGFYLNCKYICVDKTEVVIYQSGLNIRSFIPATSPLATKTLELWNMEYDVSCIEEELYKKRKDFEKKKKNLQNYINETVKQYKN
jgi:hypothetical protein